MKISNRLGCLVFVGVVFAALGGCATPASQQAMSVNFGEVAAVRNQSAKGAFVVRNVSGGKETNPLWTSQVDTKGFKGALTQSLGVTGFGSAESNTESYFVDAELQELNQPLFGMTFDVVSKVQYSIEGRGVKKVFPVTVTGSASVSDAFVAIERLRLANEKSIKENIKEFLKQVAEHFDK